MEVRDTDPPCTVAPQITGPRYPDSASLDSVTHRWCSTAMFTKEKHPYLSGSVKFQLIVQGPSIFDSRCKFPSTFSD